MAFRFILSLWFLMVLALPRVAMAAPLASVPPPSTSHLSTRSALHNSFVKLATQKRLKIVVIGNSVTHGAPFGGQRNISFYTALRDWLQAKFPAAQIELKTGIIFAIGPEVQLFRLEEKVLAEKPDLVLAEFGAANGAWGEAGREITDRATEGYIRRLRFLLPQTDCFLNLGIFRSMMPEYQVGQTPHSAAFLIGVAKHYNCALSDSGLAIAKRVTAGEAWSKFMGDDIHPNQTGYDVHSQTLIAELERQYLLFEREKPEEKAVCQIIDHAFPTASLHADPWLFPRLVPAYFAKQTQGFTIKENGRWKTLATNEKGASGSFSPGQGRVVGVLMRTASDVPPGNLEVRSPDGKWIRLSQQNEPHFTEEDDPANPLYRNFFGVYGLPLYLNIVEFRAAAEAERPRATQLEIVGFLVIERDSSISLHRGAPHG